MGLGHSNSNSPELDGWTMWNCATIACQAGRKLWLVWSPVVKHKSQIHTGQWAWSNHFVLHYSLYSLICPARLDLHRLSHVAGAIWRPLTELIYTFWPRASWPLGPLDAFGMFSLGGRSSCHWSKEEFETQPVYVGRTLKRTVGRTFDTCLTQVCISCCFLNHEQLSKLPS